MNEGHVFVGELVESLMQVGASTAISQAAALLAESGCDRVLVATTPPTELSQADLVRGMARGLAGAATAAECASSVSVVIERHASVDDAVHLMIRHNRQSVFVVDEFGDVIGMIRLGTALAALLAGPSWLGAFRIALRLDEVTR